MDSVSIHIGELLYDNDCVIVPSFGAFVAARVAASFDAKRGVMLPPRKEIVFNRNLLHDDGLLTDTIARAQNIGYREAADQVATFAATANAQLQKGGVVMLPGIGSMRVVGADVSFIPDAAAVFLHDSYGFAALPMAQLPPQKSVWLVPQTVRKMAVTAACIAALLMVAPSTTDTTDTAGYVRADMARIFTEMPTTSAPAAPTAADNNFHIIVASFKTSAEADKYIASMRYRGISNMQKINGQGRVRVSAASFATRTEAVEHNRHLKTIPGFENAWVLAD